MPHTQKLLEELTQLLQQSLRLPASLGAVAPNEPLFGGRLPLDSVDSLQWAASVERHFDLQLTDEDILEGALLTLGKMAEVLHRRLHGMRTPSPPDPSLEPQA